jgi:hypothetical protein
LRQGADIYRPRQRPSLRQRIHTPHPGCTCLTENLPGLTQRHFRTVNILYEGIVTAILGQGLSPLAILAGMMLLLIFLGVFVDQVSMMLITLPVFMPSGLKSI